MKANRKVIISTFASNVNRVQQIVEACIKTNRKLALLGRSMVNVVEVALEKGYLHIPDGMLIEASEVNRFRSKAGSDTLYRKSRRTDGSFSAFSEWKL